ncbi:Peptide chain release factor prfb3 protein [Thalictrum thalictroides]|uniref:Peptide chain release factor prfb3 protein n=1 Tax=Thalictrum thalictroides TaxID=46969 RepID=A0A7J6V9G3_THATH|nr:Peptide chain release factor prfb3 protein [Thalictrum thalictroides]
MANVKVEAFSVGRDNSFSALFRSKWGGLKNTHFSSLLFSVPIRASYSMEDKNKKELGLFSLRRKIDDAVLRAETLGPMALEFEEASQIKQEEVLHHYDLWDDVARSNEILTDLADTTKVVDNLKDLRYKAEEAKLITQLAEMDAINYGLFKHAYNASLDLSKLMDRYEMSKLLSGPYDADGACIVITAGSEGVYSEIWAARILRMYTKWAEKQGYNGRLVEKYSSKGGGIKSATLEFESEYAYGYLSGERGVHRMMRSSIIDESNSAYVDVIPLFLKNDSDLKLDEEELVISSALQDEDQPVNQSGPAISIRHIPTGITVQSLGERNRFANQTKALSRLKAKLLVIAVEQGVFDVKDIKADAILDILQQETRRYIFDPYKLVQDVKTGIQLPGLNSILDGNIEPIIGAHISTRLATGRV